MATLCKVDEGRTWYMINKVASCEETVSGVQTPSLNHSRLSEWNIWNWLVWLLNFTRSATCSCTCVITQSSSSVIPRPSAYRSRDDVCECTRLTNQRTHHSLSAASRGAIELNCCWPNFRPIKRIDPQKCCTHAVIMGHYRLRPLFMYGQNFCNCFICKTNSRS